MDRSVKELEALLGEVRETQDEWLERDEDDDLADVAARVRDSMASEVRRPPSRRAAWIGWAAAAAALLAVGGAYAAGRAWPAAGETAAAPLTWRVDSPVAQTFDGWIATDEAPGRVSFSDESGLALEPHTELRVTDARADGATLILEQGELEARITHRDRPTWRVLAGPYAVHVRGTTFRVRRDDDRFELELIEGAVDLVGACVEGTRRVRVGDRVELSCPVGETEDEGIDERVEDERVEDERVEDERVEDERVEDERVEEETLGALGEAPGSVAAAPSPTEEASSADRPAQRAASRSEGDTSSPPLEEGEAEIRDEEVSEPPSPADDLALARATMAAGDAAAAAERLASLRREHAGTEESALAAFLLGRIAFDDQRDAAAAAQWFARYLAERPNGALAREARGRQLEALDRLGRVDEAQARADEYLSRHPNGPHATLARRLAGR